MKSSSKNKMLRKELAFALLLIIFIIPFVFAKPLISEAPTDLSYRSGLEVKTEYRDNGPGAGSLLSETNYYYEFHPIAPQARQNINPIIGCNGAIKGTPPKTYCAGTPRYKEATDGYTLSDLEYRGDFVDTNSLYWRAYAAGFKTYIDIDYSLAISHEVRHYWQDYYDPQHIFTNMITKQAIAEGLTGGADNFRYILPIWKKFHNLDIRPHGTF